MSNSALRFLYSSIIITVITREMTISDTQSLQANGTIRFLTLSIGYVNFSIEYNSYHVIVLVLVLPTRIPNVIQYLYYNKLNMVM